MASKSNTSQDRNMKRLKDEQQVRQRPGVIFGTNDENGAFNGINEIIANCIDEAREGHGSSIRINVEQGPEGEGDIITVEDDGRGLPMDWNEEEGVYNWELALLTMYASGKYDGSQYSQSLGLNGLGLTSMQFASSFMEVWATYGGKTRYINFSKGRAAGDMKLMKPIKEGTGTKIRFQPDVEVFPALRARKITPEMFLMQLRRQAMLLSGLTIEFTHYTLGKTVTLCYKEGIVEYIGTLTEKTILPKAIEFTDSDIGTDDPLADPEPYKVNMRVAFNFGRDVDEELSNGVTEIYHNASYMFEGGKTVDAFQNGITKAFTDVARNNGKLGRADKFLYKDISDILLCVATTDAPGNRTWFKNQTKGAINNEFIGQCFGQFIYNKFRFWLENSANSAVANKVISEVLLNKKAREEGAEVSKKVIGTLSKTVAFGNKPKSFRDCSSKDVLKRELYIVEGRSALGAVKTACDPKFQAVFGLRGKPINCLKEKLSRVLNNDIIGDLYRVLGCGLEVKSEHIQGLPQYDLLKLKWGKVIICTDADVDGMHIRCLLLTMFYILSPSLLKSGRIFIAETPLYELSYKSETRFAYDESEKEAYLAEFESMGAKPNQIRIQRSKGLGEDDAEMLHITTMHPVHRRLIRVDYIEEEAAQVRDFFNALLGDDIENRRMLIDSYFETVDGDLD